MLVVDMPDQINSRMQPSIGTFPAPMHTSIYPSYFNVGLGAQHNQQMLMPQEQMRSQQCLAQPQQEYFRAALEALRQQQIEYSMYMERAQKTTEAAEKCAEILLLKCLTQDQQTQYWQDRSFIVFGGDTGTQYRIRRGSAFNIKAFRNEIHIFSLCGRPKITLPVADIMLAQKFALELEEKQFLRLANRHNIIQQNEMMNFVRKIAGWI